MCIATILFGGGYFYYIAEAVCPTPFTYRIGEIDEGFDITPDEAKVAVTAAAEVWEEATKKNLFAYDADSDFTINFIFDERQAFAKAEDTFKEKLDAAENINDAIGDTYATLVSQYSDLKSSYTKRIEEYERRLNTYNETVAKYNDEGGAPKDVYDDLENEKKALDKERNILNTTSTQLNILVDEINNIGEKGNSLVQTYNEGVYTYNEKFGESHEFTQGDYQRDRINIYTYENQRELELVLAHELGHSLSLNHVTGSSSVMFYLIGEQLPGLTLSEADLGEFNKVCGSMSVWDKIRLQFNI